MAIQYKEYLVLDKDIGELIILKASNEDLFPKAMNSIEDIEEMKIKDFIMELDEIVKKGQIIDFMNMIARNKLKKIIKLLILDADEIIIYNSYYKNHQTQSEIAKRFNITRQSVSKKMKKIDQKIENVMKLFEEEKVLENIM